MRHSSALMSGLLIVLAAACAEAAFVHDLSDDFSASTNPSSPWSYGWTTTLGSALNLYNTPANNPPIDAWTDSSHVVSGAPAVANNPSGSNAVFGDATFFANKFHAHPGSLEEYSVARFDVPETALLSLDGSFWGADETPTTTDVHILHNGVSIFSANISTFGAGVSYFLDLPVTAGDTIEFAVGAGSNGFASDWTALDASLIGNDLILPVPEPGTLLLLSGMLLAGPLSLARRRRRAS
jgi:hypothetical protein